MVIEATTIQAVQDFANKPLKNNKDIIISSVGAFKDSEITYKLTKTALNNNKQIYIPSGAIGGLDYDTISKFPGRAKKSITYFY